jgi:hypothetical protein
VKTANGGPLVAGTANKLILSSGAANVALKGALLYGQDSNGVRQGSFTDKGNTNTFVPFPGCGKNPQGQVSGVIQQTGISATVSATCLMFYDRHHLTILIGCLHFSCLQCTCLYQGWKSYTGRPLRDRKWLWGLEVQLRSDRFKLYQNHMRSYRENCIIAGAQCKYTQNLGRHLDCMVTLITPCID